jgi:hypothetical protein
VQARQAPDNGGAPVVSQSNPPDQAWPPRRNQSDHVGGRQMINVGTMFSSSWNKFSKYIGMAILIYIVGALLAIVGLITLGIVSIPIIAGMFAAFRKMQRGEAPDFNDLFSEFANFGQWIMLWVVELVVFVVLFVVTLILRLTIINAIVTPLLGVIVNIFLFFVIPLMLDRRVSAFDAVALSFTRVKDSFGGLVLPLFLVLLVSGSAAFPVVNLLFKWLIVKILIDLVIWVITFVTAPWMLIAWWDVYDKAFAEKQ